MTSYSENVLIVWLILLPVFSYSLDQRAFGSDKVLDHLMRLQRTVTMLTTKLETTQSEVASLKKELRTARTEITAVNSTASERLNQLSGTMTGSVAFEARQRSGPVTYGNLQILKFDEVTLNKGGAYNPKSGIFTAPVTGTYIFWASILSADNGDFQVRLYRDQEVLLKDYTGRVLTHGKATLMFITQVKKGQHVWFANWEVGAVTKVNGNIHSSYGGTLLTTL